jgi:hypothetical protein
MLSAGVFVVAFLLAGTDLWPCGTHAASLLNYGGITSRYYIQVWGMVSDVLF